MARDCDGDAECNRNTPREADWTDDDLQYSKITWSTRSICPSPYITKTCLCERETVCVCVSMSLSVCVSVCESRCHQMLDRSQSSNMFLVMQTNQKSLKTDKMATEQLFPDVSSFILDSSISSTWPSEVGMFCIAPPGAVFHPQCFSRFCCTRA